MRSKSLKFKPYFLAILVSGCVFFSGCTEDDVIPEHTSTINYTLDGRTVQLGDPFPIAVDVLEDGQVDFTIFVELTANNRGDRLYVGMNPIGNNVMKSGPAIDENFLNMGFIIAESPGSTIGYNVQPNQQWTTDFGILAIRNTFTNGTVSYEGNWVDSDQLVAIQLKINQSTHFGWLRIKFNKVTETVSLIDYAYNTTANQPIVAGAKTN